MFGRYTGAIKPYTDEEIKIKQIRELIKEADSYNGTVWVSDCRTLKDEFERLVASKLKEVV